MNQLDHLMKQIQLLPPEDLVKLLRATAELLEQKWVSTTTPSVDYVAFIGSGKGVFATSEEADRFIRAERDAWEK